VGGTYPPGRPAQIFLSVSFRSVPVLNTQWINGTPKKCWVKVCPDISNIGNADPKSPTTTALEGVTDIGNSVADPKPIGNTSVTDPKPIGNVVTDIGNSLKAPPQADSSTPVTDVTDAPAQITLANFYRLAPKLTHAPAAVHIPLADLPPTPGGEPLNPPGACP